jgi:hypothetical protein
MFSNDMAQLVFEADNFPEISKGILREYMALAANGQHIKFAELVESLMDIERYDQPKQKKVHMGRGGGYHVGGEASPSLWLHKYYNFVWCIV